MTHTSFKRLKRIAHLAGYPAALPPSRPFTITTAFLVRLQLHARHHAISLLAAGNHFRAIGLTIEHQLQALHGPAWLDYWDANTHGPCRPPDYRADAWSCRSDGGHQLGHCAPRHCPITPGPVHPALIGAGEGAGPGQYDLDGFRPIYASRLLSTDPALHVNLKDIPHHLTALLPGVPLHVYGGRQFQRPRSLNHQRAARRTRFTTAIRKEVAHAL